MPKFLQIAVGLLAASLASATAWIVYFMMQTGLRGAVVGQLVMMWTYAVVVSLAHALVLGLPLFAFLKSRGWMTQWWKSAALGFLVGVTPYAIFSWPARGAKNASYTAWDGHAMVKYIVNGVPTEAAWISYGQFCFEMGALGAVGAVAAWFLWREGGLAGRSASAA